MSARWLTVLREAAATHGKAEIAKRLGYSPAVVHEVLKGTYKGRLDKVEQKVKGALMGEKVACPGFGFEITKDRCIAEQAKPRSLANPNRMKVYRACRAGCIHSRIGKGTGHGS